MNKLIRVKKKKQTNKSKNDKQNQVSPCDTVNKTTLVCINIFRQRISMIFILFFYFFIKTTFGRIVKLLVSSIIQEFVSSMEKEKKEEEEEEKKYSF